MQIQKKCEGLLTQETVIFVVLFVVFALPKASSSMEFNYGADLRQNALMMKWPSAIGKFLSSDSFGISETKMRIKSRFRSCGITLNGALESSAGFTSSDAGSAGIFGSDSGIFGKSKPLECWDFTAVHIEEKSTNLRTRVERLGFSQLSGILSRYSEP